MSLMTRVKMAGNDLSVTDQMSHASLLQSLRQTLQQYISADEMALLATTNPYRARNEIRSACKLIFDKGIWAAKGSQEKDELVEELIDSVLGLGPLESLLANRDITEIMINGSDSIFIEKEGKLFQSESVFTNDDQVRALIDRIISPLGRRIDESSPMVNARLKQGHRVNAIIPPLSLDGPVITIRKFGEYVLTLREMVLGKAVEEVVRQFLVWAVIARKNIAVSGGTGTGKTTLLNALSCEIPQHERIITIEDSAELRFLEHPHVIRLEARPKNAEGIGEVTIKDLVINALRMRPDRIVVGECRGGEALDMLQAMNTGHDGSLTTLHANSPKDAIMRLSTLVRYAVELPVDVIENQIASALDIIIQMVRGADGVRYVSEIVTFQFCRTTGFCDIKQVYKKGFGCDEGRWFDIPAWVDDLPIQGITSNEEVGAWKRAVS